MIEDIVFTPNEFILELPVGDAGGLVSGYSMDGSGFDFEEGGETSHIFIS